MKNIVPVILISTLVVGCSDSDSANSSPPPKPPSEVYGTPADTVKYIAKNQSTGEYCEALDADVWIHNEDGLILKKLDLSQSSTVLLNEVPDRGYLSHREDDGALNPGLVSVQKEVLFFNSVIEVTDYITEFGECAPYEVSYQVNVNDGYMGAYAPQALFSAHVDEPEPVYVALDNDNEVYGYSDINSVSIDKTQDRVYINSDFVNASLEDYLIQFQSQPFETYISDAEDFILLPVEAEKTLAIIEQNFDLAYFYRAEHGIQVKEDEINVTGLSDNAVDNLAMSDGYVTFATNNYAHDFLSVRRKYDDEVTYYHQDMHLLSSNTSVQFVELPSEIFEEPKWDTIQLTVGQSIDITKQRETAYNNLFGRMSVDPSKDYEDVRAVNSSMLNEYKMVHIQVDAN